MENGFQSSEGLVSRVEGLCRSVITLVGLEAELIFDLGCLQQKHLTRCQISSSKKSLCSFMKTGFQSSQGLVH